MPRPLYSHVLNLRKDVPGAGSITRSMLAPGAGIGNGTAATISFSTAVLGSWQKVVDLPSLTVRGGVVVLNAQHSLFAANAAATPYNVWLKFLRDGTTDLWVTTWQIGLAGTMPLPPLTGSDQPAAGAHVYSLYILPTGTGTTIGTAVSGTMGAYEVG